MSIETEYYDQYAGISPEEYVRKTQLENPKQVERAAKIATHVPQDIASVLDVGCGGGLALNAIAQIRPELRLVGLERSVRTAAAARKLFGLEVVEGQAEKLPFHDDEFDVVMANEILEHLPWEIYQAALTEIARVARQTILITTPYQERRQFVTCPMCACSFSPFYHVRSFSDDDLAGLFPRFSRAHQELIWVKGRAPFLYEARRLKAALGWVPGLPQHTICPQCGFRNEPRTGQTPDADPSMAPRKPAKILTVAAHTWGRLPRRKRAKWAMVRYEAQSP